MKWLIIILLTYQLHLPPSLKVKNRSPEVWDGRLLIRHRLPICILPGIH